MSKFGKYKSQTKPLLRMKKVLPIVKLSFDYNTSLRELPLFRRALNNLNTDQLIEFEIDGDGTLILPSGTYNNAVRVVNIVERVDSTGNEFFSSVIRLQNTIYSWIIPGQVDPVMTIVYSEGESETTTVGNPPTVTEIPLTKSVIYNPDPEGTTTSTQNLDQLSQ